MKTQQNDVKIALTSPLNRRLAAYSAAAGAVCAINSAQATNVTYDNGGAGWTAALTSPTNREEYLNFGSGGVVNVADASGVAST